MMFREMCLSPCPDYNPDDRRFDIKLNDDAMDFVLKDLMEGRAELGITLGHIFWLSNLPVRMFGIYAKEIYDAIAKCGSKAFIPMDNWKMVMEG